MLDQPKRYDHHRNQAERSAQARLALRYQITEIQPFKLMCPGGHVSVGMG